MNPRLLTQVAWDGQRGGSLRGLVGAAPVRLSRAGVKISFGEAEADGTMCIEGARWTWSSADEQDESRANEARGRAGSLRDALITACARVPAGRVALALSGGVDSAVLAALLRGRVAVYTLESGLAGYCEGDEAQSLADRLGLELRRVRVDEEALVRAVPGAIRACETPLYNLHPVSRYLLARAVRADECDVLITGDGADEVFGGTNGGDYLPVVGALTRAAGLTAWAPFLDPAVAGFGLDVGKRMLRDLAVELGVPVEVATRVKRPRFVPALDLERYWDDVRVTELGRWLGLAPSRASDRACVGWTTLALFCEDYPGLERCAA